MFRVAVVTLFPETLVAVTGYGVTGRAIEKGLLDVLVFNPRDYTDDPHKRVDDRPYGGGPGMVIMVQPLCDAIRAARQALPEARVAYLSPQGRCLDQQGVDEIAGRAQLILVAGRYEGIDERVIEKEVDEEWSIGDYVLSGGELPAMVMIDAVARAIPGVLGHEDSASEDSFINGLLDYPHYTRPEKIEGMSVPEVLLSGDHKAIWRWRMKQALGRTRQKRPDLLDNIQLDDEQKKLLDEYLNEKQID